ncbi:Protein FANTASTIC FOUR 2, partial [Mucuna pruriens]
MSSSSVSQGLQSCLEPRVMEPRVLSLKLALQQGSKFSQPSSTTKTNRDTEQKPLTNDTKSNGWSFPQTLPHTCNSGNKTEDQVYIHPIVKRSSSILSEKSLEMCTESLGSETGSNASESGDEISLFSFETSACFAKHANDTTTTADTTQESCEFKRVNNARHFPPPLTSIADWGGVRVRPHREGGRLILEAVASPSPRPYFHAERDGGRLRLCLFESFYDDDDEEVGDVEEGVDEEEEEEKEEEEEEEECGEEETEEECVVENMEDEMGVNKFARPSRMPRMRIIR